MKLRTLNATGVDIIMMQKAKHNVPTSNSTKVSADSAKFKS